MARYNLDLWVLLQGRKMLAEHRTIIRGYVWSATGIGVVLGPGADAAPLVGLWAAGYTHLIKSSGMDLVDQDLKASIGTIVAGLGAWFVSGKIAQVVAGLLVAGGLTMAGATGFLSLLVAGAATLSLNSTINALFTFRFLRACSKIIDDSDHTHVILSKAIVNFLIDSLLSIAEIPQDLVSTFKLMFGL